MNKNKKTTKKQIKKLPQILFITSFPPRECGIATYSQDLIHAIETKFSQSFEIKICALETADEKFNYNKNVICKLDTSKSEDYIGIAQEINQNNELKIILIQHEFGFFQLSDGADFLQFIKSLNKPIVIAFHTVLPPKNKIFKDALCQIIDVCTSIVVMTFSSKELLASDYDIPRDKIEVIPHGTHLVANTDIEKLKANYGFNGKMVLSTFGLISSGKGIETTLDALPAIIKVHPETLFLIIGKTHPGVIKHEGEKYRTMLEEKVKTLKIGKHVKFVNQYLSLSVLLEYLRLTDIYLFTSKDPNQAVSGTFSYAMSCGCPIISTPIPQAREMLDENTGIIIDFLNSKQLADGVIHLLNDDGLRRNISMNTLHKIAPTAWENSAIAHSLLFDKILENKLPLEYNDPGINLSHFKEMTTDFGMIQFSKINLPDLNSGYTLDDNARALIAISMHYELTHEISDLKLLYIYLDFIKFCIQDDGSFLNYVDENKQFTQQNNETNLEDSNGRAVWALGYLISINRLIPDAMIEEAILLINKAMLNIGNIHSSRAMAFCIKGLAYSYKENIQQQAVDLIEIFADRLAAMYAHESENEWDWYESYLTYANSLLPEAMLLASLTLDKDKYKVIAKKSFDFLLSHTFDDEEIKVISNKTWLMKWGERAEFGEQPIDVTYTILALKAFYNEFDDESYLEKIKVAFNWFLGKNHLHQIIYNPCTGGCYDGLEQYQVNLNQGAESTVSYLLARLSIEEYVKS